MNLCKTSLLKLLPVDKDIYFAPSSMCLCYYSAPDLGILINPRSAESQLGQEDNDDSNDIFSISLTESRQL